MKYILFILVGMFNSSYAKSEDFVKSLVPKGYSLAQEYLYKQDSTLDKSDLIKNSSAIFDFNQDGLEDVALLVEKTVCLIPGIGKECASDHYYGAESRKLMVFLAESSGKYELFLETKNGILNYGQSANEYKDPLYSFEVNEEGILMISYTGGTDLTWSFDLEIKYIADMLKPDFYVTAIRSIWSDWAVYPSKITNDFFTLFLDRNFLNGQVELIKYLTSDQENSDDGFEQHLDSKEFSLTPLRSAEEDFIFKSDTKEY